MFLLDVHLVLDLSGEPFYPFVKTLARHGVGGADMPRLVGYALEPKNLKRKTKDIFNILQDGGS